MSLRPPSSDRTVICDSAALLNSNPEQRRTPQVVVVDGPETGRKLSLDAETIHIGRDPENEFILDVPAVSRKHALIQHLAGTYSLTDSGAANGVYVNSRRLTAGETQRLYHGDSILLGTVRLLFLDPDTASRRPGDMEQTRRQHEADSWIKRIYAIDPLAEND